MMDPISLNSFGQSQDWYAQNLTAYFKDKLDAANSISNSATLSDESKHRVIKTLNNQQLGPYDATEASNLALETLGTLMYLADNDPHFVRKDRGDSAFFDAKSTKAAGINHRDSGLTTALQVLQGNIGKIGDDSGIDLMSLLESLMTGEIPKVGNKERDELIALLHQILQNGIEDLMELSMVSVLISLIGLVNIPVSLLEDIKNKIDDFIDLASSRVSDFLEMLAFLQIVQSLVSTIPELNTPKIEATKEEAVGKEAKQKAHQGKGHETISIDTDEGTLLIKFEPVSAENSLSEFSRNSQTSKIENFILNLGAQRSNDHDLNLGQFTFNSDQKVNETDEANNESEGDDSQNEKRAIFVEIQESLKKIGEEQNHRLSAGFLTLIQDGIQHELSTLFDKIDLDHRILSP